MSHAFAQNRRFKDTHGLDASYICILKRRSDLHECNLFVRSLGFSAIIAF